MKKVIVTTTINAPTEAIEKFSQMDGWELIVVADRKTPESSWGNVKCTYYSPECQHRDFPEISEFLGWNNIQRRNLGFLLALKNDAEIIATVDDDNIPYESWGDNLIVGKEIEVDVYEASDVVFDPLSVSNSNYLWHRGFPIELLPNRLDVEYVGKQKRKIQVQANLWDGDPDVDAIERIALAPIVKFKQFHPYCSNQISPFNSQNTILSRTALKKYVMFPFVGRMDDIWGSYFLQSYFPGSVAYCEPTVFQKRNKQDLILNLENEILGYRDTLKFVQSLPNLYQSIPNRTADFIRIYFDYVENEF